MRFHTLMILFFAVFSFYACSSGDKNTGSTADNGGDKTTNTTPTNTKDIIETISPDEFKQKLEATASAQLVDVRTPGEFEGGNLENSINIDFQGEKFKEQIAALDKEKPLFVYCQAGGRSANSAKVCKELGFKKVYDMSGGYSQWSQMSK